MLPFTNFHRVTVKASSGGSRSIPLNLSTPQQGGLQELDVVNGRDQTLQQPMFSPSASSDDGSLRVWDAASKACIRVIEQEQALRCACYSPDGRFLAVGQQDGAVTVFDANSYQEVSPYKR